MSNAPKKYTKTWQELLSIVEILKGFRNILLGQRIKVFPGQKNVVYESELKTFQRVMRWRVLLESGPEIEYVKAPKNTGSETLSRLPKQGDIIDVDVVILFVLVDDNTFRV